MLVVRLKINRMRNTTVIPPSVIGCESAKMFPLTAYRINERRRTIAADGPRSEVDAIRAKPNKPRHRTREIGFSFLGKVFGLTHFSALVRCC